jgi:hypothetical protein
VRISFVTFATSGYPECCNQQCPTAGLNEDWMARVN